MTKENANLSVAMKLILVLIMVLFAQSTFAQVDKAAQAEKLVDDGIKLIQLRKPESFQAAIVKLNAARNLYQVIKDLSGEATTLFFIGFANENLKQEKEALQFYAQSMSLMEKFILALPEVNSNNSAELLKKMSESMNLLMLNYHNSAAIYTSLGNKEKAIENYIEALSIARELTNKEQEEGILMSIGKIYENTGEKIKAIDYYNQALELTKVTGDKPNESSLLNQIGKIYNDLEENRKALEYFLKVLPLRRELKDRIGEGQTLANLGRVYLDLGENQKALEFLTQALPIRREVGDKYGEAITLNNIGTVYLNLGDNQKALDYFNQAAPLFKETGDEIGEATALSNVGLAYDALGNQPKALEYSTRVLVIRQKLGDKVGEAIALNNLGGIYHKQLEIQKALDYFNKSLVISKAIEARQNEGIALINIGTIYGEIGKTREAIENFNQALPIFKVIEDKNNEAATLRNLMFAWNLSGSSQSAILYGKMAVNKYQELRKNIQGLDKENQKGYLKKVEETYRYLADILIKTGRLQEAQQILNAFKDQQFFDFDKSQTKEIAQFKLTPRETNFVAGYEKLSVQLEKSLQEYNDLKKLASGREQTEKEKSQAEKLSQEILQTSIDLFVFISNGQGDFSGNAEEDKVTDIPEIRQFQTALRDLSAQTKQKTVAIYQLIGDDNFDALIITSDEIKKVSIPFKGVELNDKAKQLWGLLQSDKYDTSVLSKQIYDVVFKPLENELPKDTTTIMWSLDGNLRYIPMAALWDGQQFLAERYNHVNFTRADTERMTRNLNPNWTGIGLGTTQAQTVSLFGDKINFSALPGVTEELKEIFKQTDSKSGVLTGEVLPDAKFTKTNFLESIKQHRPVVHIASHFSFRPGDESRSFLLLGDGTAFTLDDMKKELNLFQGVDLLTLSACNTAALQADANGREVDGFAELAQRLGAGAVMSTLWSVSDASTPWLMREFYSNKQIATGMTKAEALRKAQLSLINGTAETKPLPMNEKGSSNKVEIVVNADGKRDGNNTTRAEILYVSEKNAPLYKRDEKKPFAHPYYWSPFILIGNWK